ncbi:MAG: roadblock/LC7 domain-containing protein, partial [Promethearchaeota archaeon]
MEPNTEILDELLDKLLSAKLGVGAAVLVSREGLPIASAISRGTDETRIASITSALFS